MNHPDLPRFQPLPTAGGWWIVWDREAHRVRVETRTAAEAHLAAARYEHMALVLEQPGQAEAFVRSLLSEVTS